MFKFIGFEIHNGELFIRIRFSICYTHEWDSCSIWKEQVGDED